MMGKFGRELIESMRQAAAHARGRSLRRSRVVAADDRESEKIEAAHQSAVLEGLAQAKRRQFASDAEVNAALRRFDRRDKKS